MMRLSPIAALALVRLMAVGDQGDPVSKVQKDLEPLLAHRWSGAALAEAWDRAIAELEAAGLVARLPRKTKRAAAKLATTPEGRRQALEFLGVEALKPKTTWTVLRKTYLPAMAIGLPASSDAQFKAMSSDPVFKAVLLKQRYDLPVAEIPKLDDAIDALLWKLLGFDGETRKFTVANVKAEVLNRALDDGRAADFKKAASRIVARDAGARRDDPKELRDAVLRGWIDRNGEGPTTDHDRAPRTKDQKAMAERVKAAARDCPTGRYGDNKVFIAHVWKMLQDDPDFAGMGLGGFKKFLAEANNARLLDLGRADLVQAMGADDVRQSEITYLNATFHFVRI